MMHLRIMVETRTCTLHVSTGRPCRHPLNSRTSTFMHSRRLVKSFGGNQTMG